MPGEILADVRRLECENARLARIARQLAARLETALKGRTVRGSHPFDVRSWCKNAERLIRQARQT